MASSPCTRDFVLSQDSIMGNKLSKCARLSLHERMQWCDSLGLVYTRKSYTLDQVKFSRDPGTMPHSFAEALAMCMPLSPKFTATQMRGLKDVIVAYVLKHPDDVFWTQLVELAVMIKGGKSLDLIEDWFCGICLWITFEEKRNSSLIRLIHSAAASFCHEVDRKGVSTVAKAFLEVSRSKTCAYQHCPSGCVLKHSYTCSGCRVVTYCSTYCQNAAWATHKDICRHYQELSPQRPL